MPNTRQTSVPHALLFTLAASILLASLGISIVAVALPTLIQHFAVPVSTAQWFILAYLIAITAGAMSAARLGDRYGQHKMLIIGLGLFTLMSLLCALAIHPLLLIAGRAVQGLAAALLMVLPLSLARQISHQNRLGAMMGLLGTMSAIGTALGPSLGGILIGQFGWPSIFVLLFALGMFVLLVAMQSKAIPAQAGAAPNHDIWGALSLALALVLYALATVGQPAGIALSPAALFALAALALALFCTIELRSATPLVPIRALAERALAGALLANMLVTTVMMSTLVVGPLYLSFALGLSVSQMGLVMAVGPIVAALSGVPAGKMCDRLGFRVTQRLGLAQMVLALIALASLPRVFGVAGYLLALLLLTPAFQLFLAANNSGVMLDASPAQRGMRSGLLTLTRNLGFMSGAAVMPFFFNLYLPARPLNQISPELLTQAFSRTFVLATALAALSLLLSFLAHRPNTSTVIRN
ncbi:MFS transporter [uncultured Deefgea sp.]|uniref:MFS transporter n=1 Tax=uncultured Deefgea sp. TaxID=1304914 RepID=UPI002598E860|nr:MFS transporter [uncultured Deefgea sp.]